jgi:predicted phosphodiesterase
MRVAVISDIHANLHALEAVTAAIAGEAPDAVWCLGDLVGYGPRPNECCALVRARAAICLVGNHDLLALGGDVAAGDFNPDAAAAGRWTAAVLGEEARAFLGGLRPSAEAEGVGLYHASPRDPVWEYVLSPWQAEECIELMEPRIGAIGHSHVALFFRRDGTDEVVGQQALHGLEADVSEGRWLLNPGGVGQPRDGDPRAAWLLLDTDDWTAAWRRVEYPVDEAADAIRRAGLPAMLAERLYTGQ